MGDQRVRSWLSSPLSPSTQSNEAQTRIVPHCSIIGLGDRAQAPRRAVRDRRALGDGRRLENQVDAAIAAARVDSPPAAQPIALPPSFILACNTDPFFNGGDEVAI
jgi:hypothetical protein